MHDARTVLGLIDLPHARRDGYTHQVYGLYILRLVVSPIVRFSAVLVTIVIDSKGHGLCELEGQFPQAISHLEHKVERPRVQHELPLCTFGPPVVLVQPLSERNH